MAVRVTVLILLLGISLDGTATGAMPSCLKCHPAHYEEIGRCTDCHKGDDRTTRMEIAHLNLITGALVRYRVPGNPSPETGRQWIDKAGCRRCHTINARGNILATNLDRISGRHPQDLLSSILKPVTSMPDLRFDEKTAAHMVNAILSSARSDNQSTSKLPVIVRFANKWEQRKNIFEKRCGGCHKVLTKEFGGLGNGTAGPNLSGLLTDFYPATYGKAQRWTEDRLRQWIANPRNFRANARMQPVLINIVELTELYAYFRP